MSPASPPGSTGSSSASVLIRGSGHYKSVAATAACMAAHAQTAGSNWEGGVITGPSFESSAEAALLLQSIWRSFLARFRVMCVCKVNLLADTISVVLYMIGNAIINKHELNCILGTRPTFLCDISAYSHLACMLVVNYT